MNEGVVPALNWLKQRQSLIAAVAMLGLTIALSGVLLVLDSSHQHEKAHHVIAHLARVDAEEDLRLTRAALDAAVDAALDEAAFQSPEWERPRRDVLEQARACYARQAARDSSGRAARRWAAIVSDFGEREAAIPLFEEAVARLSAAASTNTDDPGLRRELARGWIGLGDACLGSGQRQRAVEAFQAALSVAADHRDCQVERARSLFGLGAVLTPVRGAPPDQGRDAEAALTEAMMLLEQLIVEEPTRAAQRAELTRCRRQLSYLLHATGRSSEAETALQQAIAGLKELIADRPSTPAFRDALRGLYHDLGELLLALDRIDEGRAALIQSAVLAEELAHNHSDSVAYRRTWASALLNQALAHRDGPLQDEEAPLRRALTIWHRLRSGAAHSECALNEAWTHWRLGDALRRRGKSAGALVEFRYALHAAEEGLKLPADSHRFSLQLTRLAALADLGEPDQVLREVQQLAEKATPRELFALAATCAVSAEHGGEPYATLALNLLTRAAGADPRWRAAAVTDRDFDSVRDRPEFQRLLAQP